MLNASIPLLIIALLVAIIIHEAAHAWMADRLGDPTARLAGRISLNPMAHIDPVGTILFPLLLIIFRFPIIFGWAKPVRFDPFNLKNPRKDAALISLAGPMANFALAIIFSIVMRLLVLPFIGLSMFAEFLIPFIMLNVILGIFNLVPMHPLDGGKILVGLLPQKDAHEADLFMKRYGIIIVLLLIFPIIGGTSPLFLVISPIINTVLNILIPGAPII